MHKKTIIVLALACGVVCQDVGASSGNLSSSPKSVTKAVTKEANKAGQASKASNSPKTSYLTRAWGEVKDAGRFLATEFKSMNKDLGEYFSR